MDTKRLLALIDRFYAASLEPTQWEEAASQLAHFLDSESTAIQARAEIGNVGLRATTSNYDIAAQQAYLAHFHKLDAWTNAWQAGKPYGVWSGSELVDPDRLKRSEFYRDFCRRLGIFHFLGAALKLSSGPMLLLGVHRPMQCDDFGPEARQRLELVLPHLARAMDIHVMLGAAGVQRRLTFETFAALSLAAIVVDADGRVVFANEEAEALFAATGGLTVRQQRLVARDPRQEAALRQAIGRASAVTTGRTAPPADVLLVRRPGKRALSVMVAPFHVADAPQRACVVVLVSDPDARQAPAARVLAALYKLTPAEARLLEALLQGERLAHYAERVGISINTASTQLKQVFAKTDTNRQAELMRLMLSDPIASFGGLGNSKQR